MSQSLRPEFKGRVLTSGEREGMLRDLVRAYMGWDYVEIGTAYGSSAILVALTNPNITVHCIDPMDGMYGVVDAMTPDGIFPTPEILEKNCQEHGIKYGTRVVLHQQKHPPFPEAIKDHRFGVGYVDADHSREGCLADFNGLKDRCQCLVFDNYEKGSVRWAVKQAVAEGWEIIRQAAEPNPESKQRVYRMAAIVRSYKVPCL